jgi:sugar phosphate isomerase/epimerase
MKLGIVLAGVLRTKIDFGELCTWAANNGYGAIDVPADRPDAADLARKAGLELAATSAGAPLIVADDAEREKNVATVIAKIDQAADQGIPFVQLGHARVPDPAVVPWGAPDAETVRVAKLGIGPAAAHAEKRGVKLVMENYAAAGRNFATTPANWRALFEAVPSPAFGLCFDPSHLIALQVDYLRALREFGGRVHYAHAKDTEINSEALYQHGILARDYGRMNSSLGPNAQGWWRFALPGFGTVDWGRYTGTLREVGFDGVLSVEHEDDAWGWRADVNRTLEGLKVTQRYLRPFLD